MAKKKRKVKKNMLIFTIVNLLFTILLVGLIISLNIVPMKYISIITIILVVIDIVNLFLIKSKKKAPRVTGYVISIIFILISVVGSYYVGKTNSFLNKAFNNAKNSYTSTYHVVTSINSDLENIEDLNGTTLGLYETMPNVDLALKELGTKIKLTSKNYKDINTLLRDLSKEVVDATIIEKNIYEAFIENKLIDENHYKIIDTFDIEIEEEKEEIVDDGNTFSIYIGGVDFTEKNTDFNMVVTINKKTHKILLTSLPRDYYVTVSEKGMKELLGYVGYFGINTSRKTVEDLLKTNIDYYVKINTDSIVGLVDTLGGIEFCSDISYTTTHAQVTGTYDDTKGQKLVVNKGCNQYSGIEILTIARERKAFADGDRQRQKNCQDIMINIFKKMTKPENIANYGNVLNAVSDLYTTNIPRDLVTELAKDTINNGSNWTFEQQSATGRDSRAYVHMGTIQDYVMIPDENSLNTVITNIKNIYKGK